MPIQFRPQTLAFLAFALALTACEKEAPPTTTTAATTAPAAKPVPAAVEQKPAPQPAAVVPAAAPAAAATEFDLSTADPAWKGWVASGPANAKVLADGIKGARIAANGNDAFDLTFAPTKSPMKDHKDGLKFAEKSGNVKVTYLVDTADKLEWTNEGTGYKNWNFVWNYKVAGKDVSCASGPMGATSEALFTQLKEACSTLKKK